MNGILVIDKPQGMTSFDVVRKVRRLCKTKRVGHAGTLDPLATGVLPVAVGWATRLVEYMMEGEKVYQAGLRLGATTDTQDAEGKVLQQRDWHGIDRATFEQTAGSFVGSIEQLPPMYSALKKDGKPLYKLARQGVEVDRELRQVKIESLSVDAFDPPDVTITVRCSKGTYIRTLCHDLGERLGCGAHMTSLRRMACGTFNIEACHTLTELKALAEQGKKIPLLRPAEALSDWPSINLSGDPLKRLQDGVAPDMSALEMDGISEDDKVKFMAREQLVAVARFVPGGFGKRAGDFELLKVFPLAEKER